MQPDRRFTSKAVPFQPRRTADHNLIAEARRVTKGLVKGTHHHRTIRFGDTNSPLLEIFLKCVNVPAFSSMDERRVGSAPVVSLHIL